MKIDVDNLKQTTVRKFDCVENQKANQKERRNTRLHIKDNVIITGVVFMSLGVIFSILLGLGVFK